MITPRWAGLLFGLLGTVGMAVMASAESFWIAILGGALVAGSALTLTLSIWRVAQANRRNAEQRLRALAATLKGVNQSARATSTSLNGVAESLNGVAASLREVRAGLGDTDARVLDMDASIEKLRELNGRTSDRVDAFAQAILEEVIQLQLDASEHAAAVQLLGTGSSEVSRGRSRIARQGRRPSAWDCGAVFDISALKTVPGLWLMGYFCRPGSPVRGAESSGQTQRGNRNRQWSVHRSLRKGIGTDRRRWPRVRARA